MILFQKMQFSFKALRFELTYYFYIIITYTYIDYFDVSIYNLFSVINMKLNIKIITLNRLYDCCNQFILVRR